ncbi:hypothetical protein JRQ81_020112 [Phrynocephalus forsythii]|uniref:Uncharacterized protein n=1 Tax=Phrynocephalus forsythii TaxID=171643 RepID=A0A9Q1AZ68_9SAUR|nr:hypothetical protein JRQ81_020112 [Phrynocephalus forsythii]
MIRKMRKEEMAVADLHIYTKVLNKYKNRSTQSLLEPLMAAGFPVHTAKSRADPQIVSL